ncbi:hypothetical protein DTO013E5_553 [Penicillium roqueforti]|uniref:Genomic scaffold, ProqFM164S02 n=1 Tax=Penicillium roqueforti (strain FM164) TaxID=1365484 RepID=W6Q9D3_PENRF|nr:uncharacterized protein LCP9604111_586 [Penicillium roqueforti]CDM30799.1 unnamed protein product [Penicillium roqueforti FM164]KAF9253060.1 hypothetical protein LCP9604111_586 [Penicillium roqueforti]KAI1838574.1 hypothetical protein CBS147337_299 [Penicillium roqueforti]KAI2680518.1 hypothetical protein CBS147355_3498 [Penicillium roqueforti]KAI2691093.1 hypothetical protein LCP963914a_1294 [Penicillium roqueforti]
MGPTCTVAHCELVSDLLQQLLEGNSDTYLIVCATKAEFLVQLTAAIRSQCADPDMAASHGLLTKTIGLLARSSKIRLLFCPSLESLRAYLAIFDTAVGVATEDRSLAHDRQLIAVLDMIALHVTTSEFSAQGLSRTLASLVEASSRAGMDLQVYECVNALDPSSAVRGKMLWDVSVPLLNGSVRMRSDQSIWSGRGVTVKRVAERWFEFDQNWERMENA